MTCLQLTASEACFDGSFKASRAFRRAQAASRVPRCYEDDFWDFRLDDLRRLLEPCRAGKRLKMLGMLLCGFRLVTQDAGHQHATQPHRSCVP